MRHLSLALLLAAPLPALAQDIVPLDGTWTTVVQDVAYSDGCPADAETVFAPVTGLMMAPRDIDLEWNGTFDPRTMSVGGREGLEDWTQTDDGGWAMSLMDDDTGERMMTVTMIAISPKQVDGTLNMPATGLMGEDAPGGTECELTFTTTQTLKE